MRLIRSVIILCLLLLLPCEAVAQYTSQLYLTYIQQYKDLAIEHMQRYRIPASITLAQGILESRAGTSTLATKANNHFGIKCGGSWTGPYVLRDDDQPNEQFRKYNSARESYEDHSRFLQSRRYQGLFQLSPTDYKGWARGLKAAGYATSPTYAESLITIIENYQLYQYDRGGAPVYAQQVTVIPSASQAVPQSVKQQNLWGKAIFVSHPLQENNGLYFVQALVGDDLDAISRDTGVSKRKLRKYNEVPKDYKPYAGDIIYLEKKKRQASRDFRKNPIHVVGHNQSIHDIAQLYGIRLKRLYKLNKWTPDQNVKAGDIIRIR